jgi:hypothetical protein
MKNLLIISLFLLFACETNSQTEQQNSKDPEQPTTKRPADKQSTIEPEAEQPIEQETNEQRNIVTFEFIDEPNSTKQTLWVEWISNDTIKFEIFSETDLCNYEEYGTAVLKRGAEVDQDEKAVKNLTFEYEVIDAGQLQSIRISDPERDNARINYLYDQPRDECDPYDDLMKRKPDNMR